jgi:hypothetical protein
MLRECVRVPLLAVGGFLSERTSGSATKWLCFTGVDGALAPAVQHCAVEQYHTVAIAQHCNARECDGATMQRSGMQRCNIDALLQRRNNALLQQRNDATLGSATAQRCNARECTNAQFH